MHASVPLLLRLDGGHVLPGSDVLCELPAAMECAKAVGRYPQHRGFTPACTEAYRFLIVQQFSFKHVHA